MAKRPQTAHGKALAAFTNGLITREEYQRCCIGRAWVSGRTIFMAVRMFWRDGWTLRMRRFDSKSREWR